MVDDTKSGILKHEADEAYRRLQQGFEALRPAFLCNYKVNSMSSVQIRLLTAFGSVPIGRYFSREGLYPARNITGFAGLPTPAC
ncbi:MAG: hypothetical protein MZV70_59010 [Desulfobacterales bacterium]|nr:hypothetical protein [Desulfobacterales bacterium]